MGIAIEYLPQVLIHGFESIELTAWQYLPPTDMQEFGKQVLGIVKDRAVVSSIGLYGNPLTDSQTEEDWEFLIESAKYFGCNVVCGFTGALEDRPIDQNMERFKQVFGKLAKIAEDEGVRIAFENCDMGGTWDSPKWNIAHSPRAWEMMFNEVDSDAIGLEWEPCHQMVSLIDPLPQLKKWVNKIYHIHGKDATIDWDTIKTRGLRGGETCVWHRTPGFGDTNWTDVISILRMNGWTGSIDIEGWHDPVYRDDLEMTGQVHALRYLQMCRGGEYIANPQ